MTHFTSHARAVDHLAKRASRGAQALVEFCRAHLAHATLTLVFREDAVATHVLADAIFDFALIKLPAFRATVVDDVTTGASIVSFEAVNLFGELLVAELLDAHRPDRERVTSRHVNGQKVIQQLVAGADALVLVTFCQHIDTVTLERLQDVPVG